MCKGCICSALRLEPERRESGAPTDETFPCPHTAIRSRTPRRLLLYGNRCFKHPHDSTFSPYSQSVTQSVYGESPKPAQNIPWLLAEAQIWCWVPLSTADQGRERMSQPEALLSPLGTQMARLVILMTTLQGGFFPRCRWEAELGEQRGWAESSWQRGGLYPGSPLPSPPLPSIGAAGRRRRRGQPWLAASESFLSRCNGILD